MRKIHELKVDHAFFKALEKGDKTFEVRRKDRDFEVGDVLYLNEYEVPSGYTGNTILRIVTYILDSENFCKDGYVILGLKAL